MSESVISATQPTTQKTADKPEVSVIEMEADSHTPSPVPPQNHRQGSSAMLLDEAILARHSTRLYLPTEVPRETLERALELATHAPSNMNMQAWRVFVVTGPALSRLKTGLLSAASRGEAAVPIPIPAAFAPYRSALGRTIYGDGWGIAHDDVVGRRAAVLRNYEFFGAPVGVVVCMSKELRLGAPFALSVGLYLQSFLLALTAQGVASCAEVSIAGYPDVVRREVGIPDDLDVLVGVAVGYEDPDAHVNRIRAPHDTMEKNTFWVEE